MSSQSRGSAEAAEAEEEDRHDRVQEAAEVEGGEEDRQGRSAEGGAVLAVRWMTGGAAAEVHSRTEMAGEAAHET